MKTLLSLGLVALTAVPVAAQDSRLRTLQTGDASRGWEAVGRLDMNGTGFCTATLIAEDRVLTAAHCLFDRTTGERLQDAALTFLAGWRNGRAEAIRGVRRAAIWPGFDFAAGAALSNLPADLAVLELDRPIRTTAIRPFAIADALPGEGTPVAVVSYGRGRAEAPSLQETCHLLARRRDGVFVFSCAIESGSSGSPVFLADAEGIRIVSVISARGESDLQAISLGVRLGGRVAALSAALDSGVSGVDPGRPQGARASARFVQP